MSTTTPNMDNPDVAAPESAVDNPDVTAPEPTVNKDLEAAVEKGTAKGLMQASCHTLRSGANHITSIVEHMATREEECNRVHDLCVDYERYSTELDGSLLEILHKVEDMMKKDEQFLKEELKRHREELQATGVRLEEMAEKMKQLGEEESAEQG